MSVPKQKRSKSRKRIKRSTQNVAPKSTQKCSQCGEAKKAHRACSKCGYYKGKEVVDIMKKVEKKKAKKTQKEA